MFFVLVYKGKFERRKTKRTVKSLTLHRKGNYRCVLKYNGSNILNSFLEYRKWYYRCYLYFNDRRPVLVAYSQIFYEQSPQILFCALLVMFFIPILLAILIVCHFFSVGILLPFCRWVGYFQYQVGPLPFPLFNEEMASLKISKIEFCKIFQIFESEDLKA